MRLLLALGLGTASAKQCQVCQAAKNHMEEFVGVYDQGTVSVYEKGLDDMIMVHDSWKYYFTLNM